MRVGQRTESLDTSAVTGSVEAEQAACLNDVKDGVETTNGILHVDTGNEHTSLSQKQIDQLKKEYSKEELNKFPGPNIVREFFKRYKRDYYKDILVVNENLIPKRVLVSGRIRFTKYLPDDCAGVFFPEKSYVSFDAPIKDIRDLPVDKNTTIFTMLSKINRRKHENS